jgi:hypothetical protein
MMATLIGSPNSARDRELSDGAAPVTTSGSLYPSLPLMNENWHEHLYIISSRMVILL